MDARTLLAWNVRKVRVQRGLSQEGLAAEAGLDRAYLGGIERKQENPSVDVLDRLARTLDVPVGMLLAEPESGETEPAPLRRGRPRKIK